VWFFNFFYSHSFTYDLSLGLGLEILASFSITVFYDLNCCVDIYAISRTPNISFRMVIPFTDVGDWALYSRQLGRAAIVARAATIITKGLHRERECETPRPIVTLSPCYTHRAINIKLTGGGTKHASYLVTTNDDWRPHTAIGLHNSVGKSLGRYGCTTSSALTIGLHTYAPY